MSVYVSVNVCVWVSVSVYVSVNMCVWVSVCVSLMGKGSAVKAISFNCIKSALRICPQCTPVFIAFTFKKRYNYPLHSKRYKEGVDR